uniref:AlNc14C412G11461 protein n=1 Tax=Albugo laibachii Nc14 TaxID=890382 RepID=F0W151_9STRA|nr:AlNc14C6G827 [Albugo laibachii Nc14]CCA26768.1 AlNc14C412G11461 [Albugo laibachii Nc14]|eukprot:CCA26768.1 AlNc14C412G11461 [Albugo laibachii Nc14]
MVKEQSLYHLFCTKIEYRVYLILMGISAPLIYLIYAIPEMLFTILCFSDDAHCRHQASSACVTQFYSIGRCLVMAYYKASNDCYFLSPR